MNSIEKLTINPTTKSSDDVKASRIFGLLPVSTMNKNKIKIHPFSKNSSSDEHDISNSSIQKTSIKINSAECLSTVDVSDRVGQYHSSVLIKNDTDQIGDIYDQKSGVQTNLRNVSVPENLPTEIAIVYHHNKHSNALTQEKGDILEMISTNVNKTKTLICLDYETSTCNNSGSTKESVGIPATIITPNNDKKTFIERSNDNSLNTLKPIADSLILKLLNDSHLSHLLYGLEIKTVARIIENSLHRLRSSKHILNTTNSTKDLETDKIFVKLLHNIIKDERAKFEATESNFDNTNSTKSFDYSQNGLSNIERNNESYESKKTISVRKLYEMLMDDDTLLWKSNDLQNHHHQYESVCFNCDPIYEEINEKPPPLPINPPPILNNTPDKPYKPMFLGATKYDILSYLVDAKDRIISPSDESYSFKFLRRAQTDDSTTYKKIHEDNGKIIEITQTPNYIDHGIKSFNSEKCMTSIERNDSGVGSECSRTKYQPSNALESKNVSPVHLCEDCGKFSLINQPILI